MNMGVASGIFVTVILMVAGLWTIVCSSRRSAADVLIDLRDENEGSAREAGGAADRAERSLRALFSDELASIGLYTRDERRVYKLRQRAVVFLGAVLLAAAILMAGGRTLHVAIPGVLSALGAGYILQRWFFRTRQSDFIRKLEFFLPVVMERLVMAVKSGLDVIAALKAIVELEGKSVRQLDPVSRLLAVVCQLAEAGLGFEDALRCVAGLVRCTALRHAFLHLAVAWREGGELVMPLSELSDSTQLYFQESVEEEIAKLPVKATMPLLLTFAGLLICFITSPLIQVMSVMQKALPK